MARVKPLIHKSRDAALLAVELYNKPSIKFRTPGYIVMMIIAWTALFHAHFEKEGVKYYYRQKDSTRYKYRDGEKWAWELKRCIKEFFGSDNPPLRLNLEFIIGLRNKVEHRYLPQIDLKVLGECQALLLNYEKTLIDWFGEKFAINENLAIPIFGSSTTPELRAVGIRALQKRSFSWSTSTSTTIEQALIEKLYKVMNSAFACSWSKKLATMKALSI